MKKTIEFLKEKGIVEKVQKLVDFAPSNMADDLKDSNLKELQRHYILNELSDMDSDDFNDFMEVVTDDVVYTLNIKKHDKEGDKIAGLVYEIIKELKK